MFFSEIAHAQTSPMAAEGGLLAAILPFLIVIAVFYFLLMRPQIKREQARRQMQSALKRGDNIVTTGGIIGKISKIEDEHNIILQIAEGTDVRLARSNVEGVVETSIPKKQTASKTAGKSVAKPEAKGGKTKKSTPKKAAKKAS